MPHIPESVAESDLSRLLSQHLTLIHRGKVRDTYALPGGPEFRLVVATDRISIFDFVLPALVSDKGPVLTAMTVFWLNTLFMNLRHHLVAWGSHMDSYLPDPLRYSPELRKRAFIVDSLTMHLVECVARGYVTGSGWDAYKETGQICGIALPTGLHDGSRLPGSIFTPTTKAVVGHDEHLNTQQVIDKYGEWIAHATLAIYDRACQFAWDRGIIIADTKLEFGAVGHDDCVLGDEVLTPDSSRFWDREEYDLACRERRSPSGFDKEPVRQWGLAVPGPNGTVINIKNLSPKSEADLRLVDSLTIPQEVVDQTTGATTPFSKDSRVEALPRSNTRSSLHKRLRREGGATLDNIRFCTAFSFYIAEVLYNKGKSRFRFLLE
jgi:phosphoribosylaminoimidazole-succinocarboxamide synthase